MKKERKKKSIRARGIKKSSNFVFWLLRSTIGPVLRCRYGYRFNRRTSKGIKRPCLILSNHQTSYDQFAVGLGFKFGINFVASNQIFGHGIGSVLMQRFTQPIPFSKGSSDPSAIKKMLEVVKQGGAVGMFPSGSRSFYGDECPLQPGVAKLAKFLRVPLVLVNLKGGFLVKARWKRKHAKSKPYGEVKRVISTEELAGLSVEELDAIIKEALNHNEFSWQKESMVKIRGKRKAEYLERVLFYCPECEEYNTLKSDKDDLFCTACTMRVQVNKQGFFSKLSATEKCPESVLEWGKLQEKKLAEQDFSTFLEKPIYTDYDVELYNLPDGVRKVFLAKGDVKLFTDRLEIADKSYLLCDTKEVVVHSSNRLAFFAGDKEFVVYMKPDGNALKYSLVCELLAHNQKNIESKV